MNSLQVFKFQHNYLDYAVLNNEPLFNLNNIANILNISNPRMSIDVNDKDYVIKLDNSIVSLTYNRKLHNTGELFLTEAGLYKLIMTSKKKEAETFQKWVVKDVLPSIRKTGTYSMNSIVNTGFIYKKFNNIDIAILPDEKHEFLLSTNAVASGYGVYDSTIRKHMQKHSAELLQDIHYKYMPNKKLFWTKKGVLQLSHYIKGEKAMLFKTFIETIVINKITSDIFSNNAVNVKIMRSDLNYLDFMNVRFTLMQHDMTIWFKASEVVKCLDFNAAEKVFSNFDVWEYTRQYKTQCKTTSSFEDVLYISLQGLKAIISQMDKNIKAKLFGGFLDKVFNAPKEIKHFEIAYNDMAKDEKIQDIKSMAYLIYSAVNSDMAQDKMLYESIKQVTSSLYNNIKNL